MTAPIRPEDVLPDGDDNAAFGDVSARKGTVAAFIANAKALNELADGTPERDAVLAQLRTLAPGLRAVGVLDVFPSALAGDRCAPCRGRQILAAVTEPQPGHPLVSAWTATRTRPGFRVSPV